MRHGVSSVRPAFGSTKGQCARESCDFGRPASIAKTEIHAGNFALAVEGTCANSQPSIRRKPISRIRAQHGLPIATCCRESLCTSFVAAWLGEIVDQPTLRRHGLAVNEDLEVMYLSGPHTGVVNVERESGRALCGFVRAIQLQSGPRTGVYQPLHRMAGVVGRVKRGR